MINDFFLAQTPQIYFGNGKIGELPGLIAGFGTHVLIVTGGASFISSSHWQKLQTQREEKQMTTYHFVIDQEPSPAMIDECVAQHRDAPVAVVVAIGGGSVLDAGKAIAAMLKTPGPVKDYLEGVGTQKPPGHTLPLIAIPTTSGTGSEATKNAVISEVGENGFKKSLRHNNFVPTIALVDPALTASCPPSITASSGMDAFTQLLESYLSTKASPVTDALALSGLKHIHNGLRKAYEEGENVSARADVAYASLLSGITLANAGLGTIHGFASSIGGYFPIPHGVVCGTLMGPANRMTLEKLRKEGDNKEALTKYATVGKLFSEKEGKSDAYYADARVALIETWTSEMKIPKLSEYGIGQEDVKKIVEATGNKNNPVALDEEELAAVLEARL